MLEIAGFVTAGRLLRRSYWENPPAEFGFGGYRVHSQFSIPTGLPRRGVGSRTRLDVVDPATDARLVCELDRVGMPLMAELMVGIEGPLNREPFLVRRTGGPRLRRRARVVSVTGPVDLSLGYEHHHSVIHAGGERPRLLWTSSSGGLLSRAATHREVSVICALVVNGIEQSSPLARFLHFL